MTRRAPREARLLGLWTAGWLAVLLFAGLLWLGDLSLQWPVLVVPLIWALVAVRPRRAQSPSEAPPLGYRSDTVERPAIRPPDPRH
ncbi:hypothetical protein [Blastococcus sp. CT_GayMR16]|uniref:hypothetical protein n=1 Tax=Blastococcus sp. CT_GayMR16 TaxID=2559607 RepID=UPI001074809F|nr:hypothetical protein [Blastococcus sp. CT_GayMR16]TFV83069.1 hypothetical protein E4P38_21310 [Blastococcus sp. CT_GayMR16]